VNLVQWGVSDVGQSRRVNEDSFLLVNDLGLALVADGMGGFQRGDVASQLAINVVKEVVTEQRHILGLFRRAPSEATRAAVKAMLEMAVQRACEQIHGAATAIAGEGGRMGTTLDLVLAVGNTIFLAHVGDGRIYLVRGEECHQLTEDHSLVQQQLREGLLTPDEAKRARFKNVITRALGVFPSVMVDTMSLELDPNDCLLLCSDGLHRYFGNAELAQVLAAPVSAGVAQRLVDLSNKRGGRDNITAVVIHAAPAVDQQVPQPNQGRLELLRRVELFQYCTYRELLRVGQVASERSLKAGEHLFRSGDAGHECYIVQAGSVAIERGGVQLAVAGPSSYFGELALIDQPRRSADAVALIDTDLLVLRREAFFQIMKQDSDLAGKLMWQLLQKLAHLVRSGNARLESDTMSLEGDTRQ
jgi:PPM family protein phosphatase